jgi:predicted DNA-binding protein YlxM (UPF0122 family)
MVSQTFLDLSVMVVKDNYDVWQETEQVMADMKEYFKKDYSFIEVAKAVDFIITERYGNIVEVPDDYTC